MNQQVEVSIDIPNDNYMWQAKGLKLGQRKAIILGGWGSAKFEFEKSKTAGKDYLHIGYSNSEPVYTTCSLGHRHESSRKEYKSISVSLPWEYVDQLVSWLNDASPSDMVRAKDPDAYNIDLLRAENKKLKKIIKDMGVLK